MSLEDLPPLREGLAAAGLGARKSLGQHFLLDLNLARKIASLAGDVEGRTVLEVGPGPGGLTRALLSAGATVVAVEKDSRFFPLLEPLTAITGGRLTLVRADALDFDEGSLPRGALIVANLPYNVATPLLVKWLVGPLQPACMVLMFQKEVAHRIVANPGVKDYGRLSVIAQVVCEARIVLEVPARAFTPPPKVDSAVVRLTPRADRPAPDILADLQRLTAEAFGQRRKMLRSSLRPLGGQALCEAANVDPDARAETVPPKKYLDLVEAMRALRGA